MSQERGKTSLQCPSDGHRRVTAVIDVIVTLCRKSVGSPSDVQRCHARDSFSLADGNFELFSFSANFSSSFLF